MVTLVDAMSPVLDMAATKAFVDPLTTESASMLYILVGSLEHNQV